MKFNNINDANKAVKVIVKEFNKTDRKRINYPILFKKALVEYIKTNDVHYVDCCEALDLRHQTVYTWLKQYEEGLYSMEGAYCVSRHSKTTNNSILKKLQQEVNELLTKIELIKQCEAMGLKVT